MNYYQKQIPLNSVDNTQNLKPRLSFNNQSMKDQSAFIQNQIIQGLHIKIAYLTQQISQYKILVSKLQKELSQKYQSQIQFYQNKHNESLQQRLNKSIIRSLNRDQLLPRQSLIKQHFSTNQSSNNSNFKMSQIMKLLDVYHFQEVIPSIKSKLKRLIKLQIFANCIASLRKEIVNEVQKPQSLKQNWKWIKQIVSKSKKQSFTRKQK